MSHDHVDVLIVGAGLSGIGAAHHLQAKCPGKTYALVGPTPTQIDLECREVFARSNQLIEVIGPRLEEEALAVHADFW